MASTRLVAGSLFCSLMICSNLAWAQEAQEDASADRPATAGQMSEEARWGVSFTYVPVWSAIDSFAIMWDADQVDIDGSEFRVGFVRGSERGGHWGVSFVSKQIKDGSTVSLDPFDLGVGETIQNDFAVFNGVTIKGVEWEGFTPFVTIKDRVQIGVGYGVGVGWFQGNVEGHEFSVDFGFDPITEQFTDVAVSEEISSIPAEDIFQISVVPMGRFEAMVSVLVAPGLKLYGSGGFNFPGTQIISVSVSYLFGVG